MREEVGNGGEEQWERAECNDGGQEQRSTSRYLT